MRYSVRVTPTTPQAYAAARQRGSRGTTILFVVDTVGKPLDIPFCHDYIQSRLGFDAADYRMEYREYS